MIQGAPDYDLRGSVSISIVFVMALEYSDMRLGTSMNHSLSPTPSSHTRLIIDAELHLLAVARGQHSGSFRLRDIDILEIGSKAKVEQ
jgi:hypothetical protein